MDGAFAGLLANIAVISFLALSAYLLLLSGEISFGQQAFFAIGAYAAGMSTAMAGMPLPLGLAAGALAAGVTALLVGLATLRLRGLYFAIATLAFAEAMRIVFELFRWQIEIDGELIGPNGVDGFGDIRAAFVLGLTQGAYLAVVLGLLATLVAALVWLERTRYGRMLRQAGEDELLAELQGVPVVRVRVVAAAVSGTIAGLGGGLYAHLLTYVEPRNFDIMLGVHSLAYGLIGGLGTALGPILGVILDIGVLESSRIFSGYRMIVFGGLVALILIVRPRGLLDERTVHRIARLWSDNVAARGRGADRPHG